MDGIRNISFSLNPKSAKTYQLMGTAVFTQIPYLYASILIAGYQFSLIRMYHDIVDGRAVVVVALYASRTG